ncbi:UNVERIFIED_CONTAM: Copia protein [Sesamum angustifolium]|uniref:Copia protein n=1 Tax=Sesamum angustifolium TaxID=2727405 RepID=A0AAW2RM68_9LAMI
MSKEKPVNTPLANHSKLSSEQCPKTDREIEDMAKVPYASVVDCLMYEMVCTRPDLAYVVSQICKYMSKLGRHILEAVKCIFKYLKGIVGHGVIFGSQQNDPLVVGYVDYDYASELHDRRFTTGYVFTLALISQQVVSEHFEMAMSGAKFEVVKFDGIGNFILWQMRVKDLLEKK